MTMTLDSQSKKHRSTENVERNHNEKQTQSVALLVENAPKNKRKSRSVQSTEFRVINASIVLSIPPVFASDLRVGVEEMLDSMVMRHIPSLQGVLLAHSNIRFMTQTASIHGDCPFAVCNVTFDATVWGPRVSMKLVGRINVCSPDHISLLVHRTFNVSIPRHHIPQDQWVFEYGPAENDPEFGGGKVWDSGSESISITDKGGDMDMDDSTKVSGDIREAESSGHWVHHLTGSKLGYPDGYVEFTVIGLTVANEMLSLQGSIQPDPFSPEHVPHPNKESTSPTLHQDHQDETPEFELHKENGEEEGEGKSDEDEFQCIAKLTDEAKANQKAKRAREGAERIEKAKKRKRQESRAGVGDGLQPDKKAGRKRLKETT